MDEQDNPSYQARGSELFNIYFPTASTLGGVGNSGFADISVEVAPHDATLARRAATIFRTHGFVIIRKALTDIGVDEVLKACRGVHSAVAQRDCDGFGNRNSGRYSFAACSPTGQCFHVRPFVQRLVDNKFVLDVLDEIYAPGNDRQAETPTQPYFVSRVSGDFCCGWVKEFQRLHSDMADASPLEATPPPTLGPHGVPIYGWYGATPLEVEPPIHDRGRPPVVSVNFAVQALTRWNGPTRLVSWEDMASYSRDAKDARAPDLDQEFKYRPHWFASRIFPLDAGDAIIRDVRVWHGGCPNLSGEARYLPCVEVSSPEYYNWWDDFCSRCEKCGSRGKCHKCCEWFSDVCESQQEKVGVSVREHPGSLPADFASKIVDPRAKQRCVDFVDHDPTAETNLRAGDLQWLSTESHWEQGAPRFSSMELSSLEAELVVLMATLGRFANGASALGEDPSEKHPSFYFTERLVALEEGTLLPNWLSDGSPDCLTQFAGTARGLRLAFDDNDFKTVRSAASTIVAKISELLDQALSVAEQRSIDSGPITKRRCLSHGSNE